MADEKINVYWFIKDEDLRKTFAKVFDQNTIMACHKLSTKGLFDVVEYLINVGKEAHVFRARDSSGNFRAVKIYKTETSDFKHMDKYLVGDERFRDVRRDKRDIVFAWTRKEHNNLDLMAKAGVRVPLPYGFHENLLVMEFIGREGVAAKTLFAGGCRDYEKAHETVVDWMARLYFKANLIHADLSEYNVLVNVDARDREELVLIDCGQSVLASHPMAQEFFERDVRNVAKYFQKQGVDTDYARAYAAVKALKAKYAAAAPARGGKGKK